MKYNWSTKKLGEVCEIVRSGITPFDGEKEYIDTNSVQNFSIIKSQPITYLKRPSRANMEPRANDVLVAKMADTVKVYLATSEDEKKRIFSTGFFILRPKNNLIIPNFLFFYCASNLFQDLKDILARGSTQKALNDEKLKKYFEIPLPPLKIQKRIVARIEELFAKIDKAKELREKAKEETEKIFPSALQEIFGKAEKKWKVEKLEEISNIFAGSSAPQGQKYFENGKYPFVRVQDLGRYGKTKNLVEIKDKVNNLALKDHHLVFAKKGTILFPKSGAAIFTNSRAILGIDAYIVGHLAAVVPDQSTVVTDWVFYWLYQFDMGKLTKTTALPSLRLSQIRNLQIPLPPLSEQKKIVAYLDDLRKKVEKLKQVEEEQLKDLEELKKSILDAAFKGQL